MKVVSLCLKSTGPLYPHAMQRCEIVPRFTCTTWRKNDENMYSLMTRPASVAFNPEILSKLSQHPLRFLPLDLLKFYSNRTNSLLPQ